MDECEPVHLKPFLHQVGGHTHMFTYDSTTVCKPLIEREYHFYQTTPECLKEFVPAFKGVVDVTFAEDSDGYNMMLASKPYSGTSGHKGKRKVFSSGGNSPGSSGGEGGKSDSDSDHDNPTRATVKKSSTESEDSVRVATSTSQSYSESGQATFEVKDGEAKAKANSGCVPNPWSIRCHKKHMDKMREASAGPAPKKFILLENVVSQLRYPCVLDLKMGTRQHGDDETEEKREKKIKRCLDTTSSSLGLRVCGMQMYQKDTGQFVCHNKYHGRQLSKENVRDALYEFLDDGVELRLDLIDQILVRLRQLCSVLSKQNTFRFFSSSLLIMYDGKDRGAVDSQKLSPTAMSSDKEDRAQSVKTSTADDLEQSHPWTSERRNDPTKHTSPERSQSHDLSLKNSYETKRRAVDVRMIDFAHTTHQGFRHDRIRSGPDTGYLFGLENLIHMFEELKEQYS